VEARPFAEMFEKYFQAKKPKASKKLRLPSLSKLDIEKKEKALQEKNGDFLEVKEAGVSSVQKKIVALEKQSTCKPKTAIVGRTLSKDFPTTSSTKNNQENDVTTGTPPTKKTFLFSSRKEKRPLQDLEPNPTVNAKKTRPTPNMRKSIPLPLERKTCSKKDEKSKKELLESVITTCKEPSQSAQGISMQRLQLFTSMLSDIFRNETGGDDFLSKEDFIVALKRRMTSTATKFTDAKIQNCLHKLQDDNKIFLAEEEGMIYRI